ncbi:MAG: hypothetical protein CMJ18_26210 [Phycisphaeraceae bacterium]|nr:hypothetical protein [Phycisphaeraceae bacterium]
MKAARRRIRRWLIRMLAGLLLVIVASEIVFRTVVPASDSINPVYDRTTSMLRYEANRTGHYRSGSIRDGFFRINNHGFNSVRDYASARTPGRSRIAIIGTSAILGAEVHVRDTTAAVLEQRLQEQGADCEVYVFAFSYMHLAQALHVTRHVVDRYAPDLIVIDEMSMSHLRRDLELVDHHVSFLSVSVGEDGAITEHPPHPMSDMLHRIVRRSATVRYLHKNLRIGWLLRRKRAQLAQWWSGRGASPATPPSQAPPGPPPPPAIAKWKQPDRLAALDYLLDKLAALAAPPRRMLLLTGPRGASCLEFDCPTDASPFDEHFRMKTESEKLALLELTEAYLEDWRAHGKPYVFPDDSHANERGHRIKAEAIAAYLLHENWLTSTKAPRRPPTPDPSP